MSLGATLLVSPRLPSAGADESTRFVVSPTGRAVDRVIVLNLRFDLGPHKVTHSTV